MGFVKTNPRLFIHALI